MKICSCCKQKKSINDFYKDKSRPSGLNYKCKECADALNLIWKQNNAEKYKEIQTQWFKKNPKNNREAVKKYREKNLDLARAKSRKYQSDHPEKARESARKYKATPKGILHTRMSKRINEVLKGTKARRSWCDLVDYTVDDLKQHIEKQFYGGMSWSNYGEWHIDHIIPVSAHNFATADDIDFKRCWALSNLQPLWAKENLSKNGKLQKPFQPSLGLCI